MLACTPHPGLGTIRLERPPIVRVVDLASCREHTVQARPAAPAQPGPVRVVVRRHGTTGRQSIVYRGRVVLTVRESYARAPAGAPGPILLAELSPDRRWILYAIDPFGSSSIVADGITLRVVPASGGASRVLAGPVHKYLWCGGRLVFTAGGWRVATTNTRLDVAAPPSWTVRPLVRDSGRAWGALACAPDGRSLVVQSQRKSGDANFFHTKWALWRVGLDGSAAQLTHPPRGYADESPRISRDGATVLFVRSRRGVGKLYALRGGAVVGPLLSLGYSLGYYGTQDWWQSMRWSSAAVSP